MSNIPARDLATAIAMMQRAEQQTKRIEQGEQLEYDSAANFFDAFEETEVTSQNDNGN